MSTLPHVAETGSLETGLVNFLPLPVASEPRPPLVHLVIEPDTGVSVVYLLAAEALIARHERRTGQSAASTVGRFGVIVVCHGFPFVLLCATVYVTGNRSRCGVRSVHAVESRGRVVAPNLGTIRRDPASDEPPLFAIPHERRLR